MSRNLKVQIQSIQFVYSYEDHLSVYFIWLVIVCGCETLSLIKSNQNKLFIFERKIKKMFGPWQDEDTGE